MARLGNQTCLPESERCGTVAGYFLSVAAAAIAMVFSGAMLLMVRDMQSYWIILPVLLALNVMVLGNLLVMVWAMLRINAARAREQPATAAEQEQNAQERHLRLA